MDFFAGPARIVGLLKEWITGSGWTLESGIAESSRNDRVRVGRQRSSVALQSVRQVHRVQGIIVRLQAFEGPVEGRDWTTRQETKGRRRLPLGFGQFGQSEETNVGKSEQTIDQC